MKRIYPFLILGILLCSCKQEKKTVEEAAPDPVPIPEKIAGAHGYENWKDVNEIAFTFNVDRDTTHYERSWIWNVREQEVTSIMAGDTISYYRNAVDSTVVDIDAGFINDKYWLLAPFNLVWDRDSYTYEVQEEAVSPLSGKSFRKLTIIYGDVGGYTPGDAYDFYFTEDHVVREWVFRKSNQSEPSSITSWEDYMDANGLLISKMHKGKDNAFSISFTGIRVR